MKMDDLRILVGKSAPTRELDKKSSKLSKSTDNMCIRLYGSLGVSVYWIVWPHAEKQVRT